MSEHSELAHMFTVNGQQEYNNIRWIIWRLHRNGSPPLNKNGLPTTLAFVQWQYMHM